jgi:hypothetical protein
MVGTSASAGVHGRGDVPSQTRGPARGRIGWLFGLTHGHCTQFLNFQESYPRDHADRAEWIGLSTPRCRGTR